MGLVKIVLGQILDKTGLTLAVIWIFLVMLAEVLGVG